MAQESYIVQATRYFHFPFSIACCKSEMAVRNYFSAEKIFAVISLAEAFKVGKKVKSH